MMSHRSCQHQGFFCPPNARLEPRRVSRNVMIESHDPRGRPYYWIDEHVPLADAEPGTDYAAVRDGLVSITPLRFDHTAEEMLGELQKWTRSL